MRVVVLKKSSEDASYYSKESQEGTVVGFRATFLRVSLIDGAGTRVEYPGYIVYLGYETPYPTRLSLGTCVRYCVPKLLGT